MIKNNFVVGLLCLQMVMAIHSNEDPVVTTGESAAVQAVPVALAAENTVPVESSIQEVSTRSSSSVSRVFRPGVYRFTSFGTLRRVSDQMLPIIVSPNKVFTRYRIQQGVVTLVATNIPASQVYDRVRSAFRIISPLEQAAISGLQALFLSRPGSSASTFESK